MKDGTDDDGDAIAAPEYRAFLRRRRRVALLIVLVGLGVALLAAQALRSSPAERALHLRDVGQRVALEGDLVEAESLLRRSLVDDPGDPTTHALLGELLLMTDREDEGAAALRESVRLEPSHPRANTLLAERALEAGDFTAATEHAEAATSIRPAHPSALSLRARIELESGRPGVAVTTWLRLADQLPADPRPPLQAALITEALGRLGFLPRRSDEARALFQRVRENAHASGDAEALALAEVALGLPATAPEGAPPAVTLWRAAQAGQGAAALEELAADDPAAQRALVEALARTGWIAEARSAWVDGSGGPAALRALLTLQLAERQATDLEDALSPSLLPAAPLPNPVEPVLLAGLLRATEPGGVEERRVRIGFDGLAWLVLAPEDRPGALTREHVQGQVDDLLRWAPSDAVGLLWKGILLADTSPRDALAAFEAAYGAATRAESHRLPADLAFVQALLERGDGARAADCVSFTPGDPIRAALTVRALLAAGRVDEAVAHGRDARALNRWHPALAHAQLLALSARSRARPAAPVDLVERNVLLAIRHLALGRSQEAARVLLPVLEALPDHGDANTLLEDAWAHVARRAAAQVTPGPDGESSAILAAFAFEQAGSADRAIALLEARNAEQPTFGVALALAELLADNGHEERAQALLHAAVEEDPERETAWLGLADLERSSGESGAAEALYLRVLAAAAPGPVGVRAAHSALDVASGSSTTRDAVRAALTRWADEIDAVESEVLVARLDLADGHPERLLGPGAPGGEDLRLRVLRALAAARTGDFAGAEERLVAVRMSAPAHAGVGSLLSDVRTARAEADLLAGRTEPAYRRLVLALRDAPSNDRAMRLLVRALRVHDVPAEAVAKTLDEIGPGTGAGALLRALAAFEAGEFGRAWDDASSALDADRARPLALETAVAAALADGAPDRGEDACDRAMAVRGRSSDVLLLLARCRAAQGRSRDADRLLRESLDRDPTNLAAAHESVRRLLSAGRSGPAREVATAFAAATSEAAAAGALLIAAGDAESARGVLERRVEVAPNDGAAGLQLGRALVRTGALDAAREQFEATLDAVPAAAFDLVGVYARTDALDDARTRFAARVEERPDDAASWCVVGMIAEFDGEGARAEQAYRAAVRAGPSFGLAHNNLAWVLTTLFEDRAGEALDPARMAVALEPRNGEFRDTLGWALLRSGRKEPALVELQAAVRLLPGSAPAHWHLAQACEALGRTEQARDLYRDVRRLDAEFAQANAVDAAIERTAGD